MTPRLLVSTLILFLSFCSYSIHSFSTPPAKWAVRDRHHAKKGGVVPLNGQRRLDVIAIGDPPRAADATEILTTASRRKFLAGAGPMAFGALGWRPASAAAASKDKGPALPRLLPLVEEARSQLDAVPPLIKEGKWDSVRAILIKPPLSDCWTKGSYPALLQDFANAIGDELPDGDELAALEAREEARTHLRFLDMAVYNNIFNPIATEGESGATKELVRSYYEDPINEFKASAAAFDDLVNLANKG
mmetsp:Transcript_8476/g.25609  ORF Transcript_8476/g.25609 Transcript_8476/m.25609 type:complete len:247 (-) Transcript_8476:192-932(-)